MLGIEDAVIGVIGASVGGGLLYSAKTHVQKVSALHAEAVANGYVEEEKPHYVWTAGKTAMMLRPVGLGFVGLLGFIGIIALMTNAIQILTFFGLSIALIGYAVWFYFHTEYRVSAVPKSRPAPVEDTPVDAVNEGAVSEMAAPAETAEAPAQPIAAPAATPAE